MKNKNNCGNKIKIDTETTSGSSSCPFTVHSTYWPSVQHKHAKEDSKIITKSDSNSKNNLHRNRWGTDVYRYDQQAMNALIHACTENHEAVVRFLVKKCRESSKEEKAKFVMTAQRWSRRLVTDFVNDYKVDPALWYASAHGNSNIVKLLMDACGARAEYRKDPTIYSSTPLEEASEWGHSSTVKVLLEREGSDPRSKTGKKARALAAGAGYVAVVTCLDAWKHRLDQLDAFLVVEDLRADDDDRTANDTASVNSGCNKRSYRLAPGLLPPVFNKITRRYDLTYRLLCRHVDIVCCQGINE